MGAFLLPLLGAVGAGAGFEVGLRGIGAGYNYATGKGLSQERALLTQAILNQVAGRPFAQPVDINDLDAAGGRAFASTITAGNMRESIESADRVNTLRDLMFGRADAIRAASIQSQPHPVELLAAMRGLS